MSVKDLSFALPADKVVGSMALSASCRYSAFGMHDGSVVIYNDAEGTSYTSISPHFALVTAASFAPKEFGNVIATGSADHSVAIHICRGPDYWQPIFEVSDLDGAITNLKFAKSRCLPSQEMANQAAQPDKCAGLFLAGTSTSGRVHLWSLRLDHIWSHHTFVAHVGGANAADWLKDTVSNSENEAAHNVLVTGGCDGLICVWKYIDDVWKDVQRLSGHFSSIICVTANEDGAKIASLSEDGTIIIWTRSADGLEMIRSLRRVIYESCGIAWGNSDSVLFASTPKGTIEIPIASAFEQ